MNVGLGIPIEVHVPGIRHPMIVRSGTADASTFEHIFIWNDYDLAYPDDVASIVDAGANTGLAAIFFANRFPRAKIISIEPEAENFELLRQNAAAYPNIVPVRAALWSEDTVLGLSNPDARVDSFQFDTTATQQKVEALSIPSILERFGLAQIDLLKVDIEGGETAVFEAAPAWVGQVGMFVVELHGLAAEKSFTTATASLHARRWRHGENHIVAVDAENKVV